MQTELSNFWNIIERSQKPLICFREDLEGTGTPAGGDAVASAITLAEVLQKLGKTPEVVSSGFRAVPHFEFLGAGGVIKSAVEGLRKFVISLDVSKNKISDFSYAVEDGQLHIYLTPKEGIFNETALQTRQENFRYDALIILDTPRLAALGKLYSAHPDLFFNVPIINIDHDPANEFYGQVNLVDLAASSTAEVVAQVIKHNNLQVDADMATKILAGMISKTKSFRNPNVSPRTLQLASRLIELGARRDEIIQNFYRTRSIETLKLWGRTLARLKSSPEHKLVWSLLAREDFTQAGASSDAELSDVIHELIATSPQADIIVLLYEQQPLQICALIAATGSRDAREVGKIFNADGTRALVKFCLTGLNIVESEKEVIGKLKQQLANAVH